MKLQLRSLEMGGRRNVRIGSSFKHKIWKRVEEEWCRSGFRDMR